MTDDESTVVTPARHAVVRKSVAGVQFDDTFDWLQRDTDEALAWQWQQDALAQAAARQLPGFEDLVRRTRGQLTPRLDCYARHRVLGGRHFWLQPQGDSASFEIRVAERIGDAGRVVLTSSAFRDAAGREGSLMFFEPSPDGRHLLAGVTLPGQSMGAWWWVDVATGESRRTAAKDLFLSNCGLPGWLPDGSACVVQVRDGAGEMLARWVRASAPEKASDETLPAGVVPSAVPALSMQVSPGGRWTLAVAEPHHRCAYLLRDNHDATWRPFLPPGFEGECHGEWLDDDTYAAVVTHDADLGRIVAIPAATSRDAATWLDLVPESDRNLRLLTVIGRRIVAFELEDVSLQIHVYGADGAHEGEVPIEPFGSSVVALVPRRLERTEALVFPYMSFLQAQTWYHYDFDSRRLDVVGAPGRRVEGVSVERHFAPGQGGLRIPYFEIRMAGQPAAGPRPALVNAYGGFGAAWLPFPLEHALPFIESGGVYVHACLRGGGEFGRRWREQGRYPHLQNTYDDLYAVAGDLVRRGVATQGGLAFQGHSQGGMLAGTVAVQRPDLWKVVCPTSPLLDMLEPLADTPARSAIKAYYDQHYGDVDRPEVAAYLAGISAYHNIRDGVRYPAVFAVFGEHDLGCPPFHGRKFVARLRTAMQNLPDAPPVHLRVWKNQAHGALDLDEAAVYAAEWLSFVMQQFGMQLSRE